MYRNCGCSNNFSQNDNNSNNNNNNNNNTYEESCNIDQNLYENMNGNSCSCGFNNTSAFPTNWMYGHSYVPHQQMNQVYAPEMGLKMGTIFPELVSPYCPNQSMEENNFLRKSNTIGGGCNS